MLEINLKLLDTIIDDNKNTEYGKKYNFSEIKNLDDKKQMFLSVNMMTMNHILKGCMIMEKIIY